MAKTLDFNTLKKNFITITLRDKKKTKLNVLPPSKRLYEDIQIIRSRLIDMIDLPIEEVEEKDVVGEFYEAVAHAMSRNKENIEVTKEMLEKMLDFHDIWTFLDLYIKELMETQKN